MNTIRRIMLTATLCLLAAVASHGQSQDSDSQTLRAILAELRAMHQDIRATETTQLLLAELQLQQAVVNKAAESADLAKDRLDGIHLAQKQLAADLERTQNASDKATNQDERNDLSQRIEQLKSNADLTKSAERDANLNLQAMQQRLQEAQDKLTSIDDELSTAMHQLTPAPK